jgi:mannose-6-phosphate isomerase-like protein (cupin superfamily)
MVNSEENKSNAGQFKTIKIVAILVLVILIGSFIFFRILKPLTKKETPDATEAVIFVAEDMSKRLSELEQNEDFTSDYSIPLLNTGNVSFHIHALQVGQFCPLHIHKDSEEGVLIIRGRGKIRGFMEEEVSPGSKRQIQEFPIERGGFFYASRENAHEFINESQEEMLACLVIHNPPFHGNLYTKEENIDKSAPAFYKDLEAMADSMTGAEMGEVAVAKVDAFSNIEIRMMRTLSPLNENMSRGHDLVIILLQGEANLEIAGQQVNLKPMYFLGIPAWTPFNIIPLESSDDCYYLCFYLGSA